MSKKGDLHWRAASEAKVLTSFNSVSVITEKNQDRVWSVACCSGCIWDSDPEPLCSPSHTGTCFSLPHDDRCSFKDFWSRQGQEKWVTIRLLLLIRKVFLFGSRLHVTFWSKEKDVLLHVLILAFILPPPCRLWCPQHHFKCLPSSIPLLQQPVWWGLWHRDECWVQQNTGFFLSRSHVLEEVKWNRRCALYRQQFVSYSVIKAASSGACRVLLLLNLC